VRWLAALAGACAVALLVRPPAARLPARRAGAFGQGDVAVAPSGLDAVLRRPSTSPGVGAVLAAAATATVVLGTLDGERLALALIVMSAAAGVTVLVRRSRRARTAERRQALVVDVCEALVGELRAGQPLTTSLAHCAEVWVEVGPVVAASHLGADVPAALRRVARLPGAEGLREIASAWQVAEQSGAGLAAALAQVAVTARARQGTRDLVSGELASARATARLVLVLPLASLAMSAGIGGDPWHFLLATPTGLGCLGAGLLSGGLGMLWIDRIASAVLTG
jgi:tight adherence protein B